MVHFGVILGSVLGGIWGAWTLENHAKVFNCMHFQGLDPFVAESVSGSAFGRGLAGILCDFGADWGTSGPPFSHFCQIFQGLILEAVLGRQKGAQECESGWAGGSGGAC